MNLSQADREAIAEILGRSPTTVEEHIFDVMWSEHCSYKSSKGILKKYIPTKGSDVILGIGEDAGVVRFTEYNGKTYGIVMAHESHNHPSQILPVEGSATGVGGVVRDVYCMGADVIGVMDSLHFGYDATGKNHLIEEIAENVVLGVSDYANPLGVPVLGGETIYHPSYNDNCLVNVGALGILEADDVIHSRVPEEAKTIPYDIILIGKSTDATGFGGASFASATLDSENETTNVGAVQVHDPFLKRVLVEAIKDMFREVKRINLKIGFKDLGAGGIACVTSEIAAAGGFGVDLQLDQVNVASSIFPPEVIACSETQERFCIAVPATHSQFICDIFNKKYELPHIYHNAGAVIIGRAVTEPFYTIYWHGEQICRLPIGTITTEVRANRSAQERPITRTSDTNLANNYPYSDLLLKTMELPNICSKRYVYRFYDNAVRGDTVIYPGEADSVVVTPIKGCSTGFTVNMSSNLYGGNDPYMTGAYAVAEAVRNIISVGAEPLAMTDCLNYGNPEKPDVFFDFEEGVKGLSEAAFAFSFKPNEPIPVISGNVSFYNESKQGSAIIPSPVILVAGRVNDYHQSVTLQVKRTDSVLLVVGERYPEFGATQIAECVDNLNKIAPQVRFKEEASANKLIYELIQKNIVLACHDISMGGLWVTLCEMLLGEHANFKAGAEITIPETHHPLSFLFSENGGYVIEVASSAVEMIQTHCLKEEIACYVLGQTKQTPDITIHGKLNTTVQLADIKTAWNSRNVI